jgi:hypothetical protein
MKVNTSVALKAGLIGAAAAVVLAILNSFLCGILCWVTLLVYAGAGALYVHFSSGKVELVDGAVGGALSGGIAGGAAGLVSGIFSLLGVAASTGANLLGGEAEAAAATAGGGFVGFILALGGAIVAGVVLGAIGGLLYSLVKKE